MQVVALPVGGALAAFFTYKVKFPSTLFSYHPTLLGLGWLAIVPYAMKYLRDSKQASGEKREGLVKTHALLNSLAFAATVGGLYAIYRNKENMAASKGLVAKHLVSQHGKLGALCGALASLSMSISLLKTLFSGKKGLNYAWRDKVHKFVGLLSYMVGGLAICSVVNGPWGKGNLGGLQGQRAMTAVIAACQIAVAYPATAALIG